MFLPRNSNRAENFLVLVYNLPRFRPISMGQMAVQVSLSMFVLLVFRAAVTAVGDGSEGPKAEFTGHSSPSDFENFILPH